MTASLDKVLKPIQLPDDPVAASYAIGGLLQIELSRKQHLLELPDAATRLRPSSSSCATSPASSTTASCRPSRPPTSATTPTRRCVALGPARAASCSCVLVALQRAPTRREPFRSVARRALRPSPRRQPAGSPVASSPPTPRRAGATYTVRRGDSLSSIARAFGTTSSSCRPGTRSATPRWRRTRT